MTIRRYALAAVVLLGLAILVAGHVARTAVVKPGSTPGHLSTLRPVLQRETVITIGGSIAHGWKDQAATGAKGYIARAFSALSNHTNTIYRYVDRTIIGANGTQLATMYKGRYETWLNEDKPQIVVISWGLLNDAKPKTPMPQFRQYIRAEIQAALRHHAVVFVVTPPVTKASYTQYKDQQAEYVKNEIQAAESFRKNVYVFDVFNQMKTYLTAHHQTYQPYWGDNWHPNSKGHQLAAALLYDDIIQTLGQDAITFQ